MSDTATVTLGDLVVVHNLGRTPITWQWNSRDYHIAVGGFNHIPFDLMKKECGDPRASTTSTSLRDQWGELMLIPSREDEVRRMMQLHTHVQQPGEPMFREIPKGSRDFLVKGQITNRCPEVRVETLTGEQVYTVLDDPFGDHVVAAIPTRSDQEFQRQTLTAQSDQLLKQEKVIQALARRLGIDPNELLSDPPVEPTDGLPDAPLLGAVEDQPPMVFNPRTKKVSRGRNPNPNPTTLEDLPEDE